MTGAIEYVIVKPSSTVFDERVHLYRQRYNINYWVIKNIIGQTIIYSQIKGILW